MAGPRDLKAVYDAGLKVLAKMTEMQKIRDVAPLYKTMDAMSPSDLRLGHGTPHVFAPEPENPLGRFRDDKLGTGEGAQAFTYGHYTSGDVEGTADEYRRRLSGGKGAWVNTGKMVPQQLKSDYDRALARKNFPDLKYVAPLSRSDQLLGLMDPSRLYRGVGSGMGDLAPSSHLRRALSVNNRGLDPRTFVSMLGEDPYGMLDTLLRDQRLSPQQVTSLRNLLDRNLAAERFGSTAKELSKLDPGTQDAILRGTLSDDELARAHGLRFSQPKLLNSAVQGANRATNEFGVTPWGSARSAPTLFEGHGTNTIWSPWNEARGLSPALMEATDTQVLPPVARDVLRNVLAQNARYGIRDVLQNEGLAALRQKMGFIPGGTRMVPERKWETTGGGALYEVASQLRPQDFWLLDAPVGEHAAHIPLDLLHGLKGAAERGGIPFNEIRGLEGTGHSNYQYVKHSGRGVSADEMNKGLTDELLGQGVPGAMFLRGGRRGDWEGVLDKPFQPEDYNFVFFNPELAKITKRLKKEGGVVE